MGIKSWENDFFAYQVWGGRCWELKHKLYLNYERDELETKRTLLCMFHDLSVWIIAKVEVLKFEAARCICQWCGRFKVPEYNAEGIETNYRHLQMR